jgi:hypothetical protein
MRREAERIHNTLEFTERFTGPLEGHAKVDGVAALIVVRARYMGLKESASSLLKAWLPHPKALGETGHCRGRAYYLESPAADA